MKVLRGGGDIADLDIIFGAGLEEALESRAGMLRALSLVAVREKKHDPAGPLPFRFGPGNELVDDDLVAVGEIAKLRFPKAEHVRVIERIPIVESEDGRFRE